MQNAIRQMAYGRHSRKAPRPVRQTPGSGNTSLALTIGRAVVLLGPLALTACSTALQMTTEKAAEIALGAVGIKVPENPTLPRQPKIIQLRLEAAKDVNAGADGQGLSTVVRLYKLKEENSFLTTSYATFGDPEKEKQAIGTDLVEVRELILAPGQTLDLKEKMASEAAYLGVVTLFRTPSPQRWRFAFATSMAQKSGVTIGVHACAMTATDTAPIGLTTAETALLSPVKCR